jgi:peptidoglycan/LPS O-acetylase OafA/YrhL
LRIVGKYSYAMYIFHKPLHDFVGRPLLLHFGLLRQPSSVVAVLYVVVATVVTLGAAVISFQVFERHFLALKRWFVADAGAPSVTPSPGGSVPRS